jgi:hypothetical protein
MNPFSKPNRSTDDVLEGEEAIILAGGYGDDRCGRIAADTDRRRPDFRDVEQSADGCREDGARAEDAVGRARPSGVRSQNRIRSKSAWGHGDLPQKPRFSWSERYLGNQSRTGRRPGPQTQDHSDCILTENTVSGLPVGVNRR